MKIIVPAYIYPDPTSPLWQEILMNASVVHAVVINPNSGFLFDPNYVTMVTQLKKSGITVLGYVPTTWGNRPEQAILTEVGQYFDQYDVDGVFFDEAPTGKDKVGLFRGLCKAVKGFVCLNPGVEIQDEGYLELADTICTFESNVGKYSARPRPTWLAKYPKEKFYHIIMGCSMSRAGEVLGKPIPATAVPYAPQPGYIYFTERPNEHDNPYEDLPIYFRMLRRWMPV